MNTTPIRAIVVDDEAPARQHLITLLKTHTDVAIVRECADGADAVEALQSTTIDLVFLDVQMPVLDGFGVIANIGADKMPPIIFISAYSEFAVRAFEAYAIDYLLKPFDGSRLNVALQRAKEQLAARKTQSGRGDDERLTGLLAHVEGPESDRYPEAIAIKAERSEERRVGKECRSRWSPYH